MGEPSEGLRPAVWVAAGLLAGLVGGLVAGLLRAPRRPDGERTAGATA